MCTGDEIMSAESIKRASAVYFTLLKDKVIDENSEHFQTYFDPEVRQTVLLLADESGTYIIESPKRIQLVVQPTGSVFATNFTHMKEKHKQVETKKHFHLISVVIMSFLAVIDRNQAAKIRTKREGISYYALERQVNDLMIQWDSILKAKPTFGEDERIDMKEVLTTWKYMEIDTDDYGVKKGNRRTRIGLIAGAMRLLETEGLIVILDRDDIAKVIPKTELFERIEYLYHDYDRYELLKKLMTTEEDMHAENPSN
jgi:glycine cleavage system H lipoate-binding protein